MAASIKWRGDAQCRLRRRDIFSSYTDIYYIRNARHVNNSYDIIKTYGNGWIIGQNKGVLDKK